MKKIIPGDAFNDSALKTFYGRPDEWNLETDEIDAELDVVIKYASPINQLSADDPPVCLIHYERNNKPGNIHHPNFGKHLKEAMDKLGIECIRRMDTDYPSMNEAYEDMAVFVIRQLESEEQY